MLGRRRRRTPCSRGAPTTPACTGSARACPTTRARSSRCPSGSMGAQGPRAARVGRGGGRRTGSGDRDNAPRHTDRDWRQVSVGHRECLGAAKCPFGQECFAERASEKAQRSHLIVTNHSLLAIDAIEGVPMIPEYDVVVIDEAHELRRPGHPGGDRRADGRPRSSGPPGAPQRHVEGDQADDLADAARRAARRAMATTASGPDRPGARPSSPTRWCWSATRPGPASRRTPRDSPARPTPGLTQAKGWVQEVFATAERMAAITRPTCSGSPRAATGSRRGCCVAPLQVWGPMRDKLLADKTVVFTSATLQARRRLRAPSRRRRAQAAERSSSPAGPSGPRTSSRGAASTSAAPFDYGKQGILYVAAHLPPPGRDGLGAAPARRDRRPRRRRRRPHPRAVLEPARGRGRGRGGPRAAAAPDDPGPGRRPAARAARSSSSRTRTPACSARSGCGRASTCPATPASW